MKKELWGLFVHGREDDISGLYANFYAWGSHLGEAWHKAYEAALAEKEIIDPVLMDACFLESLDDINYEGELSHLAPDIYRIPVNLLYPLGPRTTVRAADGRRADG